MMTLLPNEIVDVVVVEVREVMMLVLPCDDDVVGVREEVGENWNEWVYLNTRSEHCYRCCVTRANCDQNVLKNSRF